MSIPSHMDRRCWGDAYGNPCGALSTWDTVRVTAAFSARVYLWPGRVELDPLIALVYYSGGSGLDRTATGELVLVDRRKDV